MPADYSDLIFFIADGTDRISNGTDSISKQILNMVAEVAGYNTNILNEFVICQTDNGDKAMQFLSKALNEVIDQQALQQFEFDYYYIKLQIARACFDCSQAYENLSANLRANQKGVQSYTEPGFFYGRILIISFPETFFQNPSVLREVIVNALAKHNNQKYLSGAGLRYLFPWRDYTNEKSPSIPPLLQFIGKPEQFATFKNKIGTSSAVNVEKETKVEEGIEMTVIPAKLRRQ